MQSNLVLAGMIIFWECPFAGYALFFFWLIHRNAWTNGAQLQNRKQKWNCVISSLWRKYEINTAWVAMKERGRATERAAAQI